MTAHDSAGEERSLLIGCVGWRHPAWQVSYYPDDLPEDWQLGFYANDCGCVLLSPADLQALDVAELEDALDDLPDDFVFLLDQQQQLLSDDYLELFSSVNLVQIGSAEVQLAWRNINLGVNQQGEVKLTILDVAAPVDLRALKDALLALPNTCQYLVLRGESVTPALAQEVQQLAEMLGVA